MSTTPDDDDRTVIRPAGRPAAPKPPSPPADDGAHGLPVGTRLGEFEITQQLGEGGFGIVYLATDHSLQRRVALKEYMPGSLAARAGGSRVQVKSERHRETFEAGLASFINEARLLASFDHPALVKVHRFWEDHGTAYMVMPFYDGRTLKDTLRDLGRPPDEAWLLQLLAPLTEALAVIHAQQCYHRDIAPDNVILLAETGRPLLLDFGAARRVIGDMTQALTVILKPGYAPLEQYAEVPGMKQGPWTDVYALAAVLYFAIMGRTPPQAVGRMVNDTYVPLATAAQGRYSAGFLKAIDAALAVRPEQRTQSVEALRAQLGLEGGSPAARPVAAPAAAAGTARAAASVVQPVSTAAAAPAARGGRKALIVGGAGLAVVVAGALGLDRWLDHGKPQAPAVATTGADAPAAPSPQATTAAVPAPAAPTAPAVAASPAGLDGVQELERVIAAQSPSFVVQAQATKLAYRIGKDDIGLSVQSERDGFLYVFAHASDGTLAQVVPNSVSGTVRLKKGQTWRFPTVDGVALDAADPAGPVHLLAMVTDRQRDHSALEPQSLGAMRVFPTGPAGASVLARHAGPQPLLAGRAICPSSGACDTAYGAALIKVDVVR